jgi:hypothetical protein
MNLTLVIHDYGVGLRLVDMFFMGKARAADKIESLLLSLEAGGGQR